jgi:hypothetical protein
MPRNGTVTLVSVPFKDPEPCGCRAGGRIGEPGDDG